MTQDKLVVGNREYSVIDIEKVSSKTLRYLLRHPDTGFFFTVDRRIKTIQPLTEE